MDGHYAEIALRENGKQCEILDAGGLYSVIALGMGLILNFTVTEKSVESVAIM